MNDRRKVYTKVLATLKKQMNHAKQNDITVLSMMITGLVIGHKANLNHIASEVPVKAKEKSTEQRLARWLKNEKVDAHAMMMPFASQIIENLGNRKLTLILDGSAVGKGCSALVLGVLYCNRVLPLTWIVNEGAKGHRTAKVHIQLFEQLLPSLPEGLDCIVLGDGEFDSNELLNWLSKHKSWRFVMRTSKSNTMQTEQGERSVEAGLAVRRGQWCVERKTRLTKQGRVFVNVIGWWESKYDEPLYLVTNWDDVEAAMKAYRKRVMIETLFSDTKSRGFGIDKSKLDSPKRLERLLLAVVLAYIWMVYLGNYVLESGNRTKFETYECEKKSTFRLGMDWLKYVLKQSFRLRVRFGINKYQAVGPSAPPRRA